MLAHRTTARIVIAATAALGLLTACDGSGGSGGQAPAGGAASEAPALRRTDAPPSRAHNDSDVMFARMMIPHHLQAVQMAELAATRAEDPEVKKLAERIRAAQEPEVAAMRGWLQAWGMPESTRGHMRHGMPGMLSADDLQDLEAVSGEIFDKEFLRLMIAHHEGAVTMAQRERREGESADAKGLAQSIETSQRDEIEQMRRILDRL
ncbi:DUF305 domain-containing protein [Nonomuraea rhodomycinica]|uniref:DUF305 domain-containing protein n=1 Tax=Nonomuraea rhodomycinica TaxID=1712872 RepID=A0A7Y6IXD3_9ACTN|nr:DUF305 domain-containing protein [Nonomuraea rhodomycinica]NUW45915.1 DUF305 domain-containing protein [Nonomuraea rhodomycinica]